MKKLIIASILVFLVTAGFSQTYRQGTDYEKGSPKVLTTEWISEFILDVSLDTTAVAYSRAYDISQLPVVALESSTATEYWIRNWNADSTNYDTAAVTTTTTMTLNLELGDLMYSCYDENDSSGAVDSVKVEVLTQVSEYGAKGNSPFDSKSDAWATLHTDTVVDSSQAGANVETTRDFTLSTEAAKFVRWKVTNYSTAAADNSARCRLYWERKKKLR